MSAEAFYHTPGDNVTLPCNIPSPVSSCTSISWIFNTRVNGVTVYKVKDGKVYQNLPQASSLNMDSKCSLIMTSITANDAGRYVCQIGDDNKSDAHMFLNILTIDTLVYPAKDREVKLEWALWGHEGNSYDPNNRLQWVDGTRTLAHKDGYRYGNTLTVKPLHGSNKRYTCQFFKGNSLKIEDHYTSGFTDPNDRPPLSAIMWTLRIFGLMLIVLITVGFLGERVRNMAATKNNTDGVGDDDADVTYENVGSHSAASTLH